MLAADTNVLVRLITRDDEAQYQKALRLGMVWVSHVVLLETVWVLESAYGFDPARVFEAVDGLLHQQNVVLEKPFVVQAVLRLLLSENLDLDFADVLILETAREANRLPLATFDKALGKLEGVEKL